MLFDTGNIIRSVPIPSVSTSAMSYGAFMGLSGNLRYQLLTGAERVMQDHFNHLGVVIFFSTALRFYVYPFHCASIGGSVCILSSWNSD